MQARGGGRHAAPARAPVLGVLRLLEARAQPQDDAQRRRVLPVAARVPVLRLLVEAAALRLRACTRRTRSERAAAFDRTRTRRRETRTYGHDAVQRERAPDPGAHHGGGGGRVHHDEVLHVHHLHEQEVVQHGVEVVEHPRVRERGDGGAPRPRHHALRAGRRARPQRRQLGRLARPALRHLAEDHAARPAQRVLERTTDVLHVISPHRGGITGRNNILMFPLANNFNTNFISKLCQA